MGVETSPILSPPHGLARLEFIPTNLSSVFSVPLYSSKAKLMFFTKTHKLKFYFCLYILFEIYQTRVKAKKLCLRAMLKWTMTHGQDRFHSTIIPNELLIYYALSPKNRRLNLVYVG